MSEFAFLRATRFWALVIGAVSVYAKMKGWIGEAEMAFLATIAGGFITVRTVDRATEQKILAEAVATKQVPVTAILKIPPVQADALTDVPSTGG